MRDFLIFIKGIYWHWTAVIPFVVIPMIAGVLHVSGSVGMLIGMASGFVWIMWRLVKSA